MDAMVTARMPQAKKEIGNAVLERLGMNVSSAINLFYDHLIENGSLPFDEKPLLTPEEVIARIALVDSISLETDNRFSHMDDASIRRDRLGI
ncbi:MAG: type II toxin-antitoxin system RelB/DinJ family antitoxin [Coriobacteriaceae bacterium]|jgi:addiction module RelB/DinJ family antitoxin|nr:type II toxin-antitoxin system RelB/DinJ family antitoxin [Coriobacteriaceae bacterium]